MLTRLSQSAFGTVADLLTGLDHQLSVGAVLAGAMPGAVFVDDPTRPSAVFVHSPEGDFVGGDPNNLSFVTGLRAHLTATFDAERDGDLVLSFDHDGWLSVAEAIVPDLFLFKVPRRHYLFCGERPRPGSDLAPGYRIALIDAAFLERQQVPDHVWDWMDGNWGGAEGFLANGFGVAAVQGEAVVSWSLADCIVADRAEIGIHTAYEHRRRGLAVQVTAAAVAVAVDRGLTEVGWHCNEDNPGSYRTAESVGFRLERRYDFLAGRSQAMGEGRWP
ncbi:GNAT family N-acetyltransferase [Glycomyces arizonensis]|uniref:GNAT family N-acetyltransferase n=1 Tax=Glycomyces arizonensis TaxID=256035 RepID=UPI00041224EC|nr:GNAT family N-acetyltransferase [Glycomyces arizonensis]